ncbi:hypothetical protein HPB51_015788 [Rhipicephalus microplus]|uniref:Uncharacterized protein n=1 Tax=Rhipicephalus microplus TaxID=6941 RepID=A0A9J6EHN4_RHIMP|nr:hypothetical protein HPB51_015788 [Rhipicephalus microplus]
MSGIFQAQPETTLPSPTAALKSCWNPIVSQLKEQHSPRAETPLSTPGTPPTVYPPPAYPNRSPSGLPPSQSPTVTLLQKAREGQIPKGALYIDDQRNYYANDASDTIDQTPDIVDEACKTVLAEVLERQGVAEGISFPDFRDTDSDVQSSPDMSDEAMVASVVEVSPNDSDEDDMESDNTGDPGPTVAEAAHCVSVMRVFAEKRGLAEKLTHSISEFEAAVVAARPPRRQMKITYFVTRS